MSVYHRETRDRVGQALRAAEENKARCASRLKSMLLPRARQGLLRRLMLHCACPQPCAHIHKYQLLDKGGTALGSGRRGCLLRLAKSSKRQDGQEYVTSGKGPVSTNMSLKKAFTNALVTTSELLELIANRKIVLGAHHADHDKMGKIFSLFCSLCFS